MSFVISSLIDNMAMIYIMYIYIYTVYYICVCFITHWFTEHVSHLIYIDEYCQDCFRSLGSFRLFICKGFSGAASFAEVMWGHWSSLIIWLNKLIHWLNEVRLLTMAFWRNGFFVAILGSVFSWDSRNLEESPFGCGSALLFLGEKPRIVQCHQLKLGNSTMTSRKSGNPWRNDILSPPVFADICCFPMWSDFFVLIVNCK